MSSVDFPLQPIEVMARNHALLSTIGFMILLPVGVLVARYVRAFTPLWFPVHFAVQLFLSGPLIFAGWYYGWKTTATLGTGHFLDPHQKVGLALLILYVIQLVLGLFIHFIKLRSPFGPGTRSPQNYFHVFLGLVILALADEQVHYGMYTEWALGTGNLHLVPMAAKHAWLALLIVFWVLYAAGLALVPRQYGQEKRARHGTNSDEKALRNDQSNSGVA